MSVIKVSVNYGSPIGIVEYDKTQITSFRRVSKSTTDNTMPFFGVIIQSGSLEIIDKDKIILGYANAEYLTDNLPITIYLDNYTKGSYLARNWNYSYGNFSISVELTDSLEKWTEISYSKALELNFTALELYNELVTVSGETFLPLTTAMSDYLESITIAYCYLNTDTLLAQWNKFCQLTMCSVYKNEVGYVEISKMV